MRQVPGLRLTVWGGLGTKNAGSLVARIVASLAIKACGYSQIRGLEDPYARHIEVAPTGGWRVWHLDQSVLGLS